VRTAEAGIDREKPAERAGHGGDTVHRNVIGQGPFRFDARPYVSQVAPLLSGGAEEVAADEK
jgi:hypothetical protein